MKIFPNSVRRRLKELRSEVFDVNGLRNSMNALRAGFVGSPTIPVLRDTNIDADKARALYYNTDQSCAGGSFVAAPIIDGTADFIGTPEVNFEDIQLTSQVNNWINDFWKSSIWQMYRNALRDTECWVRLRLPFPSPLLDPEEENVCLLEIIDADRVSPYYDPVTNELIRVEIETPIFIEDEAWNPDLIQATGARVYGRMHDLHEIVTTDAYYYYDATTGEYLEEYTMANRWGFVPLVQVFNDYDSALHGGKSDLEQAYPFMKALHDLVQQTRQIHTYHADPKIKFKLDDVATFIQNNWPDSYVDGKFTGKISWRDKDVFFLESEDDASFIEANLSENNSVNFAEFLIDCICIAAEVTEGVLFRAKAEQVTVDTDEFFRFKKKIERKRNNFQEAIQNIVKMATFISTRQARRPKISWPPISISDLAAEGQAMNQIISASEVANRAGVISKQTYGQRVRRFFPAMQDYAAEQQQVQTEMDKEQSDQIDFEKRLSEAKGSTTPNNILNGNGGVNGASRNGRARLPIDLIQPPS